MRKQDLGSSIVWFGIGLFIALSSLSLNLGSLGSPESGFMPFLTGLVICLFAVVTFLQALFEKGAKEEKVWTGVRWQKLVAVILILLAYILLVKPVGYLICTFFLILALTRMIASESWVSSLTSSVLGSSLSYVLFNVFLKAYLPKGILG